MGRTLNFGPPNSIPNALWALWAQLPITNPQGRMAQFTIQVIKLFEVM
jgi:hypothetical protein